MRKIKKFLKYLLFLILIIGIGLLQSFSIRKNNAKKVSKSSVDFQGGNPYFLTENMVNKLLIQNGESLTNQAKSKLDLHNLETIVTENPYVANASVFVSISGEFKTIIKEKRPIARIIARDSSFYIDNKGVTMPLSPQYTPRVILVTGLKNESDLKELTPFLRTIDQDDFLKQELIGVQKTNKNEVVMKVRSGDYTIEFGDLNDMDVKFNKLKAFYNKSFNQEVMSSYKNINLKYHNQVVCTK